MVGNIICSHVLPYWLPCSGCYVGGYYIPAAVPHLAHRGVGVVIDESTAEAFGKLVRGYAPLRIGRGCAPLGHRPSRLRPLYADVIRPRP